MRPPLKPAVEPSSNAGRGRGRGRIADTNTSSTTSCTASGRSEVARYLLRKFENMPKARDLAEAERIRKNNLCFSCRQTGHGARAPYCPFNMERGRYAFADVPREMTKSEGDAYLRGRTAHLAITQFDDTSRHLPDQEQLLIDAPGV